MIKYLDDNNSDGTILGQTPASKIGFYGGPAVPQRSVPMEANIQGMGMGQLVTINFGWTPITNVPSYNAVECIYPVTVASGSFCASTDFLMSVNKLTCMTYFGIGGFRICSANVLAVNFVNSSSVAGTIAPGGELYTAVIAQGLPVITQTISPAAVPSLTAAEQIFTIQGSNAAGTAVINTAGQVVGIQITNGGSNYFVPPNISLAGGPPQGGINAAFGGSGPNTATNTAIIGGSPFSPFVAPNAGDVVGGIFPQTTPVVQSGMLSTSIALDYPAATAAAPYGSGATAVAVISGGAVVGAVITNPGSGYQIAPAVTFSGGNTFSPGMIAHVNRTSTISGLGVSNCRVVGPYQIGITFLNATASTITPTANEQYRFLVTNEFSAAKNILQYVWQAGTPLMVPATGVACQTASEYPVTIPGILVNDLPVGFASHMGAAVVTSLGIVGTRVAAASLLEVQVGTFGTGATIGALENFNVALWRQQPQPPTQLYYPYLNFTTAITAAGTFEVTQTVTGLGANTAVVVNKPSVTNGVVLLSSRVSAANTLAMTWQNYTSSAVCLPSEFYTVESFTNMIPSAGVNVWAYTIQGVNPSMNQLVDMANEMRDAATTFGMYKGS